LKALHLSTRIPTSLSDHDFPTFHAAIAWHLTECDVRQDKDETLQSHQLRIFSGVGQEAGAPSAGPRGLFGLLKQSLHV